MSASARHDVWAEGDAYEPYVGRWSRVVARDFLDWLQVPPEREWLDIGCGTGALSETILDQARPARVLGVDASDGFLARARRRVTDTRVEFIRGDAEALPASDGDFDAAVSGLVLNFVSDPVKAAAEMKRAVAGGGTVAAYVWDYAEGMRMMRSFWDAAAALDASASKLDEGLRFPLCRPERLAQLFRDAGVANVDTRAIDIVTEFRDFDDFWTPFLGGQGPAPGYCMSLADAQRSALREKLRASLPIRADGSIALTARAWAVRGHA